MGILKGHCLAAVFAIAAAGASVASTPFLEYDKDVKILRATGSPAITVAYTGVRAARLEIKLNGQSWGTRALDITKSSAEIAINLNLASLRPGENKIDVILFDAKNKVVGKQSTSLDVDREQNAPVQIRLPRHGETVQGTVEIHVGLGVQGRGTFVSFFVNKEFRSMKNIAPYTFLWDTTRETNGWHEIEVWSFDETQRTHKSPVAKVFVQNPGGRTERASKTDDEPVSTNPTVDPKVGQPAGAKTTDGTLDPANRGASAPAPAASLSGNRVASSVGAPKGAKVSVGERAVTAGSRDIEPGGLSYASPAVEAGTTPATGVRIANPTTVEATLVAPKVTLTYGERMPKEGPFSIWLEDRKVEFDVQPFVENGVPFTPFRHLFEAAGGKVDWEHVAKTISAVGQGQEVWIKIGNMYARVNGRIVHLQAAPYIKHGRTIVPLSFIQDALPVQIEVDATTGHVLITQAAKN